MSSDEVSYDELPSDEDEVPSDEVPSFDEVASYDEVQSDENSCEEDLSEGESFGASKSKSTRPEKPRATDAILQALGTQKKSKDDIENPYFFVEDSFLTEDIQISVDKVGKLEFPLTEETVKKIIKQSSKAKFGKGEKTILDTTVRDTQMIPGEKLKVEIKEEILSGVLSKMAKDLNVDPNARLIPHLYNMLIYEPGQFFKEHKDSEKVNNMIATMVVLLPSPHEGGELIIKHKKKQCKFSGSVHQKIVKWGAFYSDCTHEVLKVTQGFRVALTYNIELNFGNDLVSTTVNLALKKALSDYFADKDSGANPKLVYYLNHLYSEKSVNWSMLKGTDRNEALSLKAAAKELGCLPSLALVVYHRLMDHGDYGGDCYEVENDTKLKMLVDENDIKYKLKGDTISVHDNEACYSIKTEHLIKPKKSELEGPTGNEGQPQDFWYTRAAVVIFKSKWSFPIGFRNQLKSIHDLTLKPGNQKELKKKFDENSKDFLHRKLLNKVSEDDKGESDIINMLMDIALYLKDKTTAVKILSQFSADNTLKLVKIPRIMECFDKILEPASWMEILPAWKAKDNRSDYVYSYYRSDNSYENGSKDVKSVIQTYLSAYLKKHPKDYDVQVVEFLVGEIIDLLKGSQRNYWSNDSSVTDKNFQDELKYILQILEDLKNERLEDNLSKKLRQKLVDQKVVKTKEHFNMLQGLLTPNQFSRVAGVFLEQVINASLNDIEKSHEAIYTYLIDANGTMVKKLRTFFEQNFMIIRDPELRAKALQRMESKPDIYTGVLIIGAIDKMKNIDWNQNRDLINLCLKIVNKQLASSESTVNWSLIHNNTCHCTFCAPVKTFLKSATLKQETYLLTAHKKDHVMSSFKSSPTCPITFQEVKCKQKFNVTVEKTNKVVSDHQNFVAYLRAGKNNLSQIIQSLPTSGDINPPPCKVQKR